MPIPPFASAAGFLGAGAEGLSSGLQLALQMKQMQQQMEIQRSQEERAMRVLAGQEEQTRRDRITGAEDRQRAQGEWDYNHGPSMPDPQYPNMDPDLHRHDQPPAIPKYQIDNAASVAAAREAAAKTAAAKAAKPPKAGKVAANPQVAFWEDQYLKALDTALNSPLASGRKRGKETMDRGQKMLTALGYTFDENMKPVAPAAPVNPAAGEIDIGSMTTGSAGQPTATAAPLIPGYGQGNSRRIAEGKEPIEPASW